MKRHKYNLLGVNPPAGYRFVKRGEKYLKNDLWWQEPDGDNSQLTTYASFGYEDDICGFDAPYFDFWTKEHKGWIRPI